MAGSGIFVTWHGMSELAMKLGAYGAAANTVMGAAVYETALEVFGESQRQVPVDTGTLRGSGFVTRPTFGRDGVEVTVGYGGSAEEYALIVHEDLTLNHPRGGKAKYLEDPAVAAGATLGAAIRQRAIAMFEAGGVL